MNTNSALPPLKNITTRSGPNTHEGVGRPRYEFRDTFALYMGSSLDKSLGDTASLLRQESGNPG
ncbi:MAG: copper resistance protein B [Nitrospira sp.]|nr:copper resistance protein B [Nitrospira sp.]